MADRTLCHYHMPLRPPTRMRLVKAEPGPVRVLAGHHHGHVVVQDVDRQVVPLLSHQVLCLPLQDHPRTVVRIDDVVAYVVVARDGAELVLDVCRFLGS